VVPARPLTPTPPPPRPSPAGAAPFTTTGAIPLKPHRTQTIERTRLVPHTIDGQTELVLERQQIEVPVAPRDWDQAVTAAVTVMAVVLLTVSVCWSTSSIGSLLSRVVDSAAAYGGALAFDTLWIMCTAVQWLKRTEPAAAKKAEIAGRWALVAAMAAVFADGYLSGETVIGIVGAAVSALAKGGTSLAMLVHARPLDSRTQQWVEKRRADVGGQLALIPVHRELQRGQAAVDAERRRLELLADAGSADPDQSGQSADRPDPASAPVDRRSLTTKDAVRIAWDSGIRDRDDVLHDAAQRLGRPVSPDSVDRYLRDLKRGA
jgi:hypothetical protein